MTNVIKRKLVLLGLSIVTCFILCACDTDGTGPVASKLEVKAYVSKNCGEKCELISIEQVSEQPRQVNYIFKSKERDLEFTVEAYRKGEGIPTGAILFYTKAIHSNYANQIRNYYYDRINPLFADFDNGDGSYDLITSEEEIIKWAEICKEANDIYKEELEYNSFEFLSENPYGYVRARIRTSLEDDDAYFIGYNSINGKDVDVDELIKEMETNAAQGIRDGKIEQGLYPSLDKLSCSMHLSVLNHIYLNDEEMLYDTNTSEYSYYGLMTDDYKFSYYDYELDSYMMFVDCGYIAERGGSPALITAEYVAKLDGEYRILTTNQEKDLVDIKSEWEINGHKWELKAYYGSKDYINAFDVTRDGKSLDIECHKPDERYGLRKVTTLTVDDFAKLFDLSYKVDEDADAVYFYSE